MIVVAGILLIASGVLHMGAWALHDWTPDTMRLLALGIVHAGLGIAVLRGRRWSMIVAALVTLFGAVAALMLLYYTGLPGWLVTTILVSDVIIALSLGLVLTTQPADD